MKPIKIKAKRMIFDMPEEWHVKIKKQSIDQNTSMKQWLLDAVTDKFKKQQTLGWD